MTFSTCYRVLRHPSQGQTDPQRKEIAANVSLFFNFGGQSGSRTYSAMQRLGWSLAVVSAMPYAPCKVVRHVRAKIHGRMDNSVETTGRGIMQYGCFLH